MSQDEARVRAIGEVVTAMIDAVTEGKVINLNAVKNEAARRYGLRRSPKLVELIQAVPEEHREALLPQLRAKPVRTASGIAVVAVMSKPHRCPHIATTGNICVYCPGGPDSDFEYSTQSYTGYEPTSMRAIRARYDPYVQARGRVDQLRKLGHSVDKVEYILMGGTFIVPLRVPRLVHPKPPRRPERRLEHVRRRRRRRVRTEPHEVRGFDHRDPTGLLPVAAPASDAELRVHATGDWPAEHLRGRRARHQPRTHRRGRAEVLRARQRRRVQGCGPHDARPSQRRHGARPRILPRIFRKPRLSHRRFETLPDARDPRHGSLRAVAHGKVQKLRPRTTGGPRRARARVGSSVGSRVPRAARHPDAAASPPAWRRETCENSRSREWATSAFDAATFARARLASRTFTPR